MGHFRNILLSTCRTVPQLKNDVHFNFRGGVDCCQIFYLKTFNFTTHLSCKMIDMGETHLPNL